MTSWRPFRIINGQKTINWRILESHSMNRWSIYKGLSIEKNTSKETFYRPKPKMQKFLWGSFKGRKSLIWIFFLRHKTPQIKFIAKFRLESLLGRPYIELILIKHIHIFSIYDYKRHSTDRTPSGEVLHWCTTHQEEFSIKRRGFKFFLQDNIENSCRFEKKLLFALRNASY